MITTAVYSYRMARGRNVFALVDLALWVLSVRHARRHFRRLVLVTDSPGHAILAEGLGLPFDEVRVDLDGFESEFSQIWALGKLHAYATMAEPFVHLDHDLICWQPLPERMLAASVCALVAETMPPGHPRTDFYSIQGLIDYLPTTPDFVRAHYAGTEDNHAFNTGIFGGCDVSFIRDYADAAFGTLRDPTNTTFWARADGSVASVQLEQYWLAALARDRKKSVEALVTPAELDDPTDAPFRKVGVTHLWGDSKRGGVYHDRAIARCQADFPADFEHCLALAK